MSDTHVLTAAGARNIDQACDRFEKAWKAGKRPRLEEFLGAVGEPERAALLRQLLLLDWEYRRCAGDEPRASDYQTRLPDHATLIEEVGREVDESPDSTRLDVPLHAQFTPWTGATEAAQGDEPTTIGSGADRYDLLHEVGQGGIGIVFRGHDRHLGRDLAVKVLRENYQSRPDARRRFVAEARVGSRLQHPAIVPVYELGWFDGRRPYITMKLVEGHSLAVLLQRRADLGADLSRWLAVFEQVCQAMAYAHSQGVIHRDLKPANVMVGAFGEVQVMDWGFAKVLTGSGGIGDVASPADISSPASPSAEAQTTSGIMGTPAYMPPEQARGDAALVDRRADVFALGAILCEILTGRPPYVGTFNEVCVKSTGAQLDDAYRRLDTCGADDVLRDLVKRCLAAAPTDRPADAGVLARDVTAYLASAQERSRQAEMERAAAEARATEAAAKARAERNARRSTLAAAATAVVLALGAVIVPTVGYFLLRAEQRQTKTAHAAEARRRIQTRQAMDMLTGPVIEEWIGKQPAVSPEHKALLEQALDIYSEFAAETSTDEASRAGLARACHQVGRIQRILGHVPEAEAAYDRGAELYAQLLAEAPDRAEYRKERARLLTSRCDLWLTTGREARAAESLQALIGIQRQLVSEFSDPEETLQLGTSLTNLSGINKKIGKLSEAETLGREAVTILDDLIAAQPDRTNVRLGWARARENLAVVYSWTGRVADAEKGFREALEVELRLTAENANRIDIFRDLACTHSNLAYILRATGRTSDAEAENRKALQLRKTLTNWLPAHRGYRGDLAYTYNLLGIGLAAQNRPKEAEESFKNAVAIYEKLIAEASGQTDYQFGLGTVYLGLGPLLTILNRWEEAEAAEREGIRLFRALVEAHPGVPDYEHGLAGSLGNLSQCHHKRKEWAAARALLDEALPHHRAAVAANPRYREYQEFLCKNRYAYMRTYLDDNDYEAMVRTAEQLRDAAVAPNAFPEQIVWAASFMANASPLAAKDKKRPADEQAELAKSYADRAMETVRLAVKHGYNDPDRLRKWPGFASIYLRPEFRKLLADMAPPQPPQK